MFYNKTKPEYYAERIFFITSLLKKYCMDYEYIYELETVIPAVEYLYNLSDKLYCHYLGFKD